ncbi:hypothetical protein [Pseudooceanicola aestuarii]|nr:hypothetical protein [Pseudooceanicola aestuarii]
MTVHLSTRETAFGCIADMGAIPIGGKTPMSHSCHAKKLALAYQEDIDIN